MCISSLVKFTPDQQGRNILHVCVNAACVYRGASRGTALQSVLVCIAPMCVSAHVFIEDIHAQPHYQLDLQMGTEALYSIYLTRTG